MLTGSDITELNCKEFKREATEILEDAKFPVHKWESNVKKLDHEPNPTKILGHRRDKREDTIEIVPKPTKEENPVTKRQILKELSSIYDPLGILSPTMVEGNAFIGRCAMRRSVGIGKYLPTHRMIGPNGNIN